MSYKNKDFYQDMWWNDRKSGQGIYKKANGTKIDGEFIANEPKGTCTVTRSDRKTKQVYFEQEYDRKDYSYKVMVCLWVKKTGEQ